MNERLDYKGYWYLPDSPENSVAGVLTFIPKESIKLELIGSFGNEDDPLEIFENEKGDQIIHGYTSDAKKITLVNCHPFGSINFNSFPIVNYSCQYLIIGKHLANFNEPTFFKAKVQFPILSHWCHPGALRVVWKLDENERMESALISFDTYRNSNKNVIHKTQIDSNTDLYLKRGVNYDSSYSRLNPKISQYTYLEIQKNIDSPIKDFIANFHLFEQFLSLATLQAVECSSIFLYDKELFEEVDNEEKFYSSIELIYIQKNSTDDEIKAVNHGFLFTYNTIKDQYSRIIQKWFDYNVNIIPIRRHLIESIKPMRTFSSIDFLIIIQALEGFAKRFRKDKIIGKSKKVTLTEIIQGIYLEFSCIDRIKNDDINFREVVDSRNYYSHFMDRKELENIIDGSELYELTHKLRKLLICCILNFIGFDYPQINEIFNKSSSYLLERNI